MHDCYLYLRLRPSSQEYRNFFSCVFGHNFLCGCERHFHLKKLHLINTNFNSNQIKVINSFPALEKAYLFQKNRDLSKEVTLSDLDIEKFDFGGYTIQELP